MYRVSIFQGGDDDEEDEMNSLEALTIDPGSVADGDGAAHDHRGHDEQRDLQEHRETGSSGQGRHRNAAGLQLGGGFELCLFVDRCCSPKARIYRCRSTPPMAKRKVALAH